MAWLRTFSTPDDEEATTIMRDVETYLRLIVRWEAEGLQGAAWMGFIPEVLQKEIKENIRQERSVGYLDARPRAPLSYLMLSQLKDIIIGPLWEPAFKRWGALELIQGDFKKLIAVRNKIAHFRPVTNRDLRSVTRFAEDLVEWTRHYRRIRESAIVLDAQSEEKAKRTARMEMIMKWRDKQEKCGKLAHCRVRLVLVDRFTCMQISTESGSFAAKLFLRLLDKYDDRIGFVRVGEWGEQMACYVSHVIPESQCLAIFDDCLLLADDLVPKMATDQVRADFEFPQRDYVLPWRLELPLDFRV